MKPETVEQMLSLLSDLSAGVQKNAQKLSALEDAIQGTDLWEKYQESMRDPKHRGFSVSHAVAIEDLRKKLTQD